jgi:hypothetical protein
VIAPEVSKPGKDVLTLARRAIKSVIPRISGDTTARHHLEQRWRSYEVALPWVHNWDREGGLVLSRSRPSGRILSALTARVHLISVKNRGTGDM